MSSLELKIRPPVVALLVALAMWGTARWVLPAGDFPSRVTVALALAALGIALSVSGAAAFQKARTTKDPTKPQAASWLVVGGIYRFTRNPMYLGVSVVLVAWAAFLGSAWALLGPAAFVAYVSRFQIAPEERALAALFGSEYSSYKARVRRWL